MRTTFQSLSILFRITLDNKKSSCGSHDNNLSVTNPEHMAGVKEYFRALHHYLQEVKLTLGMAYKAPSISGMTPSLREIQAISAKTSLI